jgi:predicted nuclease of predicted toxin-antitoxin system
VWLLDVNIPLRVVELLAGFGVPADTAEGRGWRGLTNGALVQVAVEQGFVCVLTRDRLFSESAARALARFSRFSVVLVTLPQLRGEQFLDAFRSEWVRQQIRPVPGSLTRWPVA